MFSPVAAVGSGPGMSCAFIINCTALSQPGSGGRKDSNTDLLCGPLLVRQRAGFASRRAGFQSRCRVSHWLVKLVILLFSMKFFILKMNVWLTVDAKHWFAKKLLFYIYQWAGIYIFDMNSCDLRVMLGFYDINYFCIYCGTLCATMNSLKNDWPVDSRVNKWTGYCTLNQIYCISIASRRSYIMLSVQQSFVIFLFPCNM